MHPVAGPPVEVEDDGGAGFDVLTGAGAGTFGVAAEVEGWTQPFYLHRPLDQSVLLDEGGGHLLPDRRVSADHVGEGLDVEGAVRRRLLYRGCEGDLKHQREIGHPGDL